MHLKIKMLSLNDTQKEKIPSQIPTKQQICDDIVLLWREEPEAESWLLSQLYNRVLNERHPEWDLSSSKFEEVLLETNLYATDEKKLKTYSNQINCPSLPNWQQQLSKTKETQKLIGNIEIDNVNNNIGRGIFAKHDFKKGQLIFTEELPMVIIPPIDKLTLISHGKACALCGNSLNSISSHFIMTNGLDCNDCPSIWCSQKCKNRDIIHHPLRHGKGLRGGGAKIVDCASWRKFEKFCQENVLDSIYSIGIIFAQLLLNRQSSKLIKQRFESLCGVSQRIRAQLGDSMNVGGTLDASSGIPSMEMDPESTWNEAFDLFINTFPTLKDELTFDDFLFQIGKLNINKLSNNQIYYITSFINHHCEPNVRYEIDSKLKLSLFARKEIKTGEQLFLTYVNPLHGVKLRRRALRVNYGFICQCPRCQRELLKIDEIMKNDKERQSSKKVEETSNNNNNNNNNLKRIPTIISEEINESEIIKAVMSSPKSPSARRKSSMRNKRPDLQELLKNGQEFELEIPDVIGIGRRRRTSVRFDDTVAMAIEE